MVYIYLRISRATMHVITYENDVLSDQTAAIFWAII